MKHEWKREEKTLYTTNTSPQYIVVPTMSFLCISGQGNPNDDFFQDYIEALYAVAYAVRMSYKKPTPPPDYYDYTVYPLEGVWDLVDPTLGTTNKDNYKFTLMIRQPAFATPALVDGLIQETLKKKKLPLVAEVSFELISEGPCIQMCHLGPYDDEPASFSRMHDFADQIGVKRTAMTHREIYLSDARKTDPEKLKTVLRFMVG